MDNLAGKSLLELISIAVGEGMEVRFYPEKMMGLMFEVSFHHERFRCHKPMVMRPIDIRVCESLLREAILSMRAGINEQLRVRGLK